MTGPGWTEPFPPEAVRKGALSFAVERMLIRATVTDAGCIEFDGCVNSKGYGVISVDGRRELAHRVSYEFGIGEIPGGLTLDHLCQNKRCFRPDHLEPVTREENSRRANPHPTHCVKGHEYTAENTIEKKRGPGRIPVRNCRTCVNGQQRAGRERAKQRAKASDVQAWLDEQRDSA